MDTKICKTCGIEKPLSEYSSRLVNGKKYYRGSCHECELEYKRNHYKEKSKDEAFMEANRKRAKEYHHANKETIKEKSKIYRETHKEQIKEYRESHKELYKSYKQTEKYKEQNKEYKKNNKDKINAYRNQFRKEHHEEYLEKKKKWDKKYSQKHKEERKRYRIDNRDLINKIKREYHSKKVSTDPLYKLEIQLRGTVYSSFKRKGYKKNSHTFEIIGLEWKEFYKYLLKTFKNNYGYEWDEMEPVHIDHIIPLATATSEEEIIKLCHYSNLQLLKAKDNLDKKDKLNWKLNQN